MELTKERQTEIESELNQAYHFLNFMFVLDGYERKCYHSSIQTDYFYNQMGIERFKLIEMIKTEKFSLNYTFDKEALSKKFGEEEYEQYRYAAKDNSFKYYVCEMVYRLIKNSYNQKESEFIKDGESILSMLMFRAEEFSSLKLINYLLNFDLDYKIDAFGKDNQFFRRLLSNLNEEYREDGGFFLSRYDIILNFCKSKNISDENKVKLINFISNKNDKHQITFLINNVFNSDWFKESTLGKMEYDQVLIYAAGQGNEKLANYILDNLKYGPLDTVKTDKGTITNIEYILEKMDNSNCAKKISENSGFDMNYYDQCNYPLYQNIFSISLEKGHYDFAIEWLNRDIKRFNIDIIREATRIMNSKSIGTRFPEEFSKISNKLYECFMNLTMNSEVEEQPSLFSAIEEFINYSDPISKKQLETLKIKKTEKEKALRIEKMKQIGGILKYVLSNYEAPVVSQIVNQQKIKK